MPAILTQSQFDDLMALILAQEDGWSDQFEDLVQGLLDGQEALLALLEAAETGTALMLIGTAAERAAYATPFEGLFWVDTDAPYRGWRYRGTGWVLLAQDAADLEITVMTSRFFG